MFLIPPTLLQSGAKEACPRLCLALPCLPQNYLLQAGAKEACPRLCLALPCLPQNYLLQAGAKEACPRLCLALPCLPQNYLLQSGAKEACLSPALPRVAESAAKIRVKFGNWTILIGHSASGPTILIGHFMLVTC